MEGILVPIALFAMIAAIVITPRALRSVERQKMTDVLRAAIEKGQTLPPEVIDAMSSDVKARPPSPNRDLRTGLVWMGIAVGFISLGLGLSVEEPDAFYPMLGCAAFPGFIGLAFLIMALVARERR